MLLYYVPTPAQAYSSTASIISSVPLGSLVETIHLYSAYAMILLTFLHLVRNFFGSAHKGNRDLMWLVGIVLATVVIGFGVTGYLLPWTVISKSASDVAIGFLNFFPVGIANLGKFVAVGSGSDASELTTFLHIHTVFLPLALIALSGIEDLHVRSAWPNLRVSIWETWKRQDTIVGSQKSSSTSSCLQLLTLRFCWR